MLPRVVLLLIASSPAVQQSIDISCPQQQPRSSGARMG